MNKLDCALNYLQAINHKQENKLLMFGFFVSWYINLCMLFNMKAIIVEEQQ